MQPDAVNGRDLYRAADLTYDAAEVFLKLVVCSKDRFCFAVKDLTSGRELHIAPAADPLKHSAFELFLERSYLLAYRRLGNEVALGGHREAFKLHQVAKNFERFDM